MAPVFTEFVKKKKKKKKKYESMEATHRVIRVVLPRIHETKLSLRWRCQKQNLGRKQGRSARDLAKIYPNSTTVGADKRRLVPALNAFD